METGRDKEGQEQGRQARTQLGEQKTGKKAEGGRRTHVEQAPPSQAASVPSWAFILQAAPETPARRNMKDSRKTTKPEGSRGPAAGEAFVQKDDS